MNAEVVERLTSWRRVKRECEVRVVRVYTAREMMCFHLVLRNVDGGRGPPVHFVLGLNMDTYDWELLHSERQLGVYSKVPMPWSSGPHLKHLNT